MLNSDNIVALATPSGTGAIAIIRVSGPDALSLVDALFQSIKDLIVQMLSPHAEARPDLSSIFKSMSDELY